MSRLARKLDASGLLLFPYLIVFFRQWAWPIENQPAAWSLTLSASVAAWIGVLALKPERERGSPRGMLFWPIVALPLVFVYALRVAFPDMSYDVLNYRLFAAERALRGFPEMAGDFFPIVIPFNPMPDMMMGLFRHTLGYRLGTISNLIAAVWTGAILARFLRPYLHRQWQIFVAVLLVLMTEGVLFLLNTYMVDLLALPLLMEAAWIILRLNESERPGRDLAYSSLLLGISLAFKLTNLPVVIPLAVIGLAIAVGGRTRTGSGPVLASVALIAAPLLPWSVYSYLQTGNPVFPLYNKVFNSPYWPETNLRDTQVGPRSIEESLVWPLMFFREPRRVSELNVYAGRIPLGFIVALIVVWFRRAGRELRLLCVLLLSSTLLWSFSTGYARYALFNEMISGVCIIAAFDLLGRSIGARLRMLRPVFLTLPWAALAAGSVVSLTYVDKYEWSMRPHALNRFAAYRAEIGQVFGDYSLPEYVAHGNLALIDQAEVWVESAPLTSGVQGLLKPAIPLVNLRGHFAREAFVQRFIDTITPAAKRRMLSLSSPQELDKALRIIASRGLETGRQMPMSVGFFSRRIELPFIVIEVLPPKMAASGESPSAAEWPIPRPLPEDAYRAEISLLGHPSVMKTGERYRLAIAVKNGSRSPWPVTRFKDQLPSLRVGNHWLDTDGKTVVNDDGRAPILQPLDPGQETQVELTVAAPLTPGDYVLEIDLVQELVAWFGTRGSKTVRLAVSVE